jgi:response regulator of citrate/malate metabolism
LTHFSFQLLDATAAEHRRQRYKAASRSPVIQPLSQAAADANLPTGHKQLSPTVIQKILEASKNLTIGELTIGEPAKRFATSPTTIRRILSAYQDREHNPTSKVTGRPPQSQPLRVSNSQRKAQPVRENGQT